MVWRGLTRLFTLETGRIKEVNMAAPFHKPTPETRAEVKAMATYGVTHIQIASYVGIDPKTLRRHYREELDSAMAEAHTRVGKFLYNAASGEAIGDGATHSDCIRAAMFYAKTQMQWRETSVLDHQSSDGSMTPSRIEIVAPNDNSDD